LTDYPPEISDTIVDFDPDTLKRLPVNKSALLSKWRERNVAAAVKVVEGLPEVDGDLVPAAVDDLLIRCHTEMQRISEEFQHGARVAEVLDAIVPALRGAGRDGPLRIVDIGCGTGFVLRWLTQNKRIGEGVELIGVDYNEALIREARRLAEAEGLVCDFRVGNAFALSEPAAVYLSTGVLHHFRGSSLVDFMRLHDQPGTDAFVHFDFFRSPMTPAGSWLFHAVRMREPLAKFDGVLSAVRSHPAEHLLKAARDGAPGFESTIYGTRLYGLPIPRVFHMLVGIRPDVETFFGRHFEKRARQLGCIR